MSGFRLSVEKLLLLHCYATWLAQKTLAIFSSNQLHAKPNPTVIRSHSFSRALR